MKISQVLTIALESHYSRYVCASTSEFLCIAVKRGYNAGAYTEQECEAARHTIDLAVKGYTLHNHLREVSKKYAALTMRNGSWREHAAFAFRKAWIRRFIKRLEKKGL